jgi:hypothetical protein
MKIAYNDNEGLKILTPAMIDIDIIILADKDVPSGILYKLINEKDLPPRNTRDAWELEINQSNADGIGLTKKEFDAKYPQYIGWAVK